MRGVRLLALKDHCSRWGDLALRFSPGRFELHRNGLGFAGMSTLLTLTLFKTNGSVSRDELMRARLRVEDAIFDT